MAAGRRTVFAVVASGVTRETAEMLPAFGASPAATH